MKTVVLVGSGATLVESLSSKPARDRVPPLDVTFFKLCHLARLDGRAAVGGYMARVYGLDPFRRAYGMEEVFNLIYSDSTSADPPRDALDANWALLKMHREAIIRTTNGLECISRNGVGALFRFLLKSNGNALPVFMTFNHDLLIEKAIDRAVSLRRYSRTPWDISRAYELGFEAAVTAPNGRPFAVNPEGTITSIRVLKLHGSLNWVYPVRSANDAKNSI